MTSLSIIEVYGDETFYIPGSTDLYATSLVEDRDGVRWILTNRPIIRIGACIQAVKAGAAGLLCIEGDRWRWVDAQYLPTIKNIGPTGEFGIETHAVDVPSGDYSWRAFTLPPVITRGGSKLATPSSAFVHLHAHSEFSSLDGLSTIQEMVDAAVADGNPAIAVTDHGVCSGHPQLQSIALKSDVKPLFGLEAYFVGDRLARGPEKLVLPREPEAKDFALLATQQERTVALQVAREAWRADKERLQEGHKASQKAASDYMHLILWAMNETGLRNIWAMSTASYISGFYYKPRIDWDLLERHSEGVMCSTACLRGPLMKHIVRDDEQGARIDLGKLMGIFGDRLYVEIHTNQLEDQRKANVEAVRLANEFGIPTIAVVDSHYPCMDDAHAHQVWLSAQTNKTLADDSSLFGDDEHYHLMTTEEVRKSLDYLPGVDEMIANTVGVADRCDVMMKSRVVMPIFSRQVVGTDEDRVKADVDRLTKMCVGTPEDGHANFVRVAQREGNRYPLQVYIDRYEYEMSLLKTKGFCGYFLMVADQVRHAKSKGILVGPGRGSGAGCLVAYLCGITGIDPIQHDLLFERFLTEGRDEPPDFDIDYPSSAREEMQNYCSEVWGEDHTMRVGTHTRLKSKGVMNDLARVFPGRISYTESREISKIIERAESGRAGEPLSWEDLWAQHGDELDPYRAKYPEIFDLADRFEGRLKTYGRHAAGMVISPDEVLTDNLPMRTAENSNHPISQFDMDALTMLGYIKFDLLTLRTLDTLQVCIDDIKATRGDEINVADWDIEYRDVLVWDEICAGNTLGMFQIETPGVTKMAKALKPRNLAELADVITLVRPGPERSGLTASYLRRRAGAETVTVPDMRVADVLAPTQGCIIYQEQVMQACQILAGYSLNEADGVRKMLGKKKHELAKAAADEIAERCVSYGGMDPAAARGLGDALAEFAKYSFNKSHALSYAVIGYWTAWFKIHYPIQFQAAALSTVPKERVAEFVNDARRMGYSVKPPDVNDSRVGFTSSAMACRFGFGRVGGIGDAASAAIIENQPYTSFEDFMERKGSAAKRDTVVQLARIGAFDSLVPNRRALVERLKWEDSPQGTECQWASPTMNRHGLPCSFDWESEPVAVGKSGRPLKNQKAPPKKCTKGCRNYTPPTVPDFDALPPYTDAEIRDIELEVFGTYLTTTPFDQLAVSTEDYPDGFLAEVNRGMEVLDGDYNNYLVVAIINSTREARSEKAGTYGFVSMYAQDAALDCIAFSAVWSKAVGYMTPGKMVLADVKKTHRGLQITQISPMDMR